MLTRAHACVEGCRVLVPPRPTESDTQGHGPGISFLTHLLRSPTQVQESLTCVMRGSLPNSPASGVGAELGELITLKCPKLQCAPMCVIRLHHLMPLALGLSHSHLLKGLKSKVLGTLAYHKNQQVRIQVEGKHSGCGRWLPGVKVPNEEFSDS